MKNDDLMKLLPTLSEEQVKIITAWAARYKVEKLADDENARLCLDIINKELGTTIPFSALKAPWVVNASNMAYFVDQSFPKIKTKAVRYALFKMCIGFIIEDLKVKKIPVTFGTIWLHLVRVPQLFDEQYPGYRQAKLTGVILKAMGVNNNAIGEPG
jgi:hypothetical protein